MMMGNWNFIFPYATKLIAKLCTGQEGSGTKHMMESNATSRDGYTGEKSKHQDPTDDEWDVEEDEWEPVQHYDEWDIEDEDWVQVDHQFPPPPSTPERSQEPINTPPAATKPEGTTIEEPLAAPKPGLEVIIDPSSITPKASPKPTWKIIYESPAFPEPDPPLPAPGASGTIQNTTEAQDRARPRSKRKIYRLKVKYKDVEHLLATTEGGHQLATSEGGIYRGMTAWLRGCVGEYSNGSSQPLLAIC